VGKSLSVFLHLLNRNRGAVMKKLSFRKKAVKEDGQAMVEFALVLPILLLILCGILDFGWMFYNQLALNNICREGARYAVVNTAADHSTDAIEHHIQNYIISDYAVGDVEVEIRYSQPLDPVAGNVTVRVSKSFKWITPLIGSVTGSPTKLLDAEVIMKVES